MVSNLSTRRGILGAMALTPVVIAAPAVALPSTGMSSAIAEYQRTQHRLNNPPAGATADDRDRHADEFEAAIERLVPMQPSTPLEFAQKLAAMWDDGDFPTEGAWERIMAEARAVS